MTKEEIIKALQEIVDGNWNSQSVEAIQYAIDAISKLSLPSNFDEAVGEYLELPEINSSNQWEDLMIYDAFKAGAEWMAEQGVSYQDIISANKTIPVLSMKDVSDMGLDYGDKVIVQIRKRDWYESDK